MNATVKDARLAYECMVGRCSDSHWYRIKKIMRQHKMELNPENVCFFAEIREKIPRSGVSLSGILECYQKAAEYAKRSTKKLKGLEILMILEEYGVKPSQPTISRWFSHCGGYRQGKLYTPKQLEHILLCAFVYKSQNSHKLEAS